MTTAKKAEFETLFKALFKPLCGFSMKHIGDLEEAKGIVQDVFMAVWTKFETFPADMNIRSYLYTAVRNKSLNHIRDRKKQVMLESVPEQKSNDGNDLLEAGELEREIELAINALPDRCRQVFMMSRFEELKYNEIAQKMNISVKTVEAQMGKALRLLREHLAPFLPLLFFLLRQ